MGQQLDSTCASPTIDTIRRGRLVAVQVAFDSRDLKPVFHFKRLQGLKPGGFKLWVTTGFKLYSPHRAALGPKQDRSRTGMQRYKSKVKANFETSLSPDRLRVETRWSQTRQVSHRDVAVQVECESKL
jgi:hypothetical protein